MVIPMRRRSLPRLTDRLALGTTGFRVSPFCLGMVEDKRCVLEAFDAGINFFFLSADLHWPAYGALRDGLRTLLRSKKATRDDIVVATVCYPAQPQLNHMPFVEVLDALPELGRVDVAVTGAAYASDYPRRAPTYESHRRSGFCGIRSIGASFHSRVAARRAIESKRLDIAYVRYGPRHGGARNDLFPFVPPARRRPLVYAFKCRTGALPRGAWAEVDPGRTQWWPQREDYFRFALTRPELSGVLFSAATPRDVTRLARSLERGPLAEDEEEYMREVARYAP